MTVPCYSAALLTGEPMCRERNMPAGSDGEAGLGWTRCETEQRGGKEKKELRNEIEGRSGARKERLVGWGGKEEMEKGGRSRCGDGERGRFDPACAPG